MAEAKLIEFDIFYDYECPFVYRAAVLLQAVASSGTRRVQPRWRYFSLTQVNSKVAGWTVWNAPKDEAVPRRLAFAAAESARRQGMFDAFHMPLLHAKHRDGLDIDRRSIVEQVAADSGLDLARFKADLEDPTILAGLERDHTQASLEHGVFGTPTFVFPDGAAAYVRLATTIEGPDAVEVFDRLIGIVADEPRIREIKRPARPRPD